MCGIAGIINFDNSPVDAMVLKRMTAVISHRGPDDEGHVLLKSKNEGSISNPIEYRNTNELIDLKNHGYNVGLGFRRLSIIDISDAGHQPMCNEDRSIWIIFNGEFYNSKEYEAELKNKGHIIKSQTDTEIVLHLYEEYGIDKTLERMSGMFAFALFDMKKNKLFIVRDRVGIKPLYYYKSSKILLFSSEIKSILEHPHSPRKLDLTSTSELLNNRFVNAPNTIFYKIKKIIPGNYLEFTFNEITKQKQHCYWSLFKNIMDKKDGNIDTYHSSLISSIGNRLRSDVPLGVFLSGGLDSSVISGITTKRFNNNIKTFSAVFDNDSGVNEGWASQMVAQHLKTNHFEMECTLDIFESMNKLVWHCEEPIADPAILPTFHLSKLTREHVTVALSGEGSDETNYGYEGYLLGKVGRLLLMLPTQFRDQLINMMSTQKGSGKFYRALNILNEINSIGKNAIYKRGSFSTNILRNEYSQFYEKSGEWWKNDFQAKSVFDVMPLIDFHTWMQDDLLLKVDKMSMAHGLEVRVPYLDHNTLSLSFSIDAKHKLAPFKTKQIMRKISRNYIPKSITNRKQHGFLVPFGKYFNYDLTKINEESFIRESIKPLNQIIDTENIISNLSGKIYEEKSQTLIWLLMMLGVSVNQFNLNID